MGILGVNLIHSALYEAEPGRPGPATPRRPLRRADRGRPDRVLRARPSRSVDNRLMSLELVHCGLSSAAMFTADGKVVQPAEAFYKRPILLLRGSFRPVTNVTVDMLNCALAQFVAGAGQPGRGHPGRHRDDPEQPPGGRRHRRPRLPRPRRHPPHARPARPDHQFRRILPPGQLPPAPHHQARSAW